MKPEMLESLLLDRTLGELSPEVCALLDEHLARDPEAARRAAPFAETVILARAATRPCVATPPPRFDIARFHRSVHTQKTSARRGEWLRLAVCLVLGLGFGWLARPTASRPVIVASSPSGPHAIAGGRPAASSAGLWSRSRIASEHTNATAAGRTRPGGSPRALPFIPKTSASEEKL